MTQVCTELHAIMHNDYPFNCPWMPCMLSKHVHTFNGGCTWSRIQCNTVTTDDQLAQQEHQFSRPKFDRVRQLP